MRFFVCPDGKRFFRIHSGNAAAVLGPNGRAALRRGRGESGTVWNAHGRARRPGGPRLSKQDGMGEMHGLSGTAATKDRPRANGKRRLGQSRALPVLPLFLQKHFIVPKARGRPPGCPLVGRAVPGVRREGPACRGRRPFHPALPWSGPDPAARRVREVAGAELKI